MSEFLKIPAVILGGSDGRPSTLPETGRHEHPLSGYKGVDVRIGSRRLVDLLAERLEQVGAFQSIFLAGPADVYRPAPPGVRLIDSDGTFAENISRAVERVSELHPGSPIAFTVCDILPDVGELSDLMGRYRESPPSALWFPMIRAPKSRNALGASAWKPRYRIAVEGGPAVGVLPGHLAVVRPQGLRLPFLYRLIQIGYRTRNRSITFRKSMMVRGVLADLLFEDLRRIARLRLPTRSFSALRSGIRAAQQLREGVVTRGDLEDAVATLFVDHAHPVCQVERPAQMPIVDQLSLALDIDTEEEARQLGARVATGPA